MSKGKQRAKEKPKERRKWEMEGIKKKQGQLHWKKRGVWGVEDLKDN